MFEILTSRCPNCGANINYQKNQKEYVCEYCGSTVFLKNDDSVKFFLRNEKKEDEVDEKCKIVSERFNTILKNYIGNKNEMFLMLKERVGLVSSGKTLSQYKMMENSPYFVFKPFDEPFTYRIENRFLDHFEYKKDGSIEITYDTDDDNLFAIEYYGMVTKYNDIDELIKVLDTIIEEVKQKFAK